MKKNNVFKKVRKLLFKAKEASKRKGIYYVVRVGIKIIITKLTNSFWYYKIFKSLITFTFQGETYRYFYHKYNTTWRNERAVEIQVAWKMVKTYKGRNILEVGNVLSHYFPVNHDIVDKYEKAAGVINQDVIDFHPSKKYDLIISISTLEHVGWDENLRDHKIVHDSMKILHAIENLKRLLAPKGKMVITLPLGYNPELDKLLRNGKIQFTRRFCLKRISEDNRWIEVYWKDVQNARYNNPFHAANGLVIGIIET